MILSCRNIQKSFGIDDILKDVTFIVEDNEKVAIVGVNGAGKTTLLKIITGELQKDNGEITIKKGADIGYLSQMMNVTGNNTIEEELKSVFSKTIQAENELRELENAMGNAAGEELTAMMGKYERLSHRFEHANGYEYESRLRGVINGLGFSMLGAQRNISTLSGGQKTKVAFGKLLLSMPDILLLYEPTNHLDIESVQWLEDVFLKNYSGSVIAVSHDRYFLDKTVTKIIEIENGVSSVYNGNYSFYAIEKGRCHDIALKQYVSQQREIKRQEEIIKRLKSFNREKSIRAAESKEKRLAKMEKIEKPEGVPEKIWIVLEPQKQSGYDVLSVNGLKKSFGGIGLFDNISFELKRGETAALVGVNGVGKTTLLKMILSAQGFEKNIKLGANVEIGYFDQEYATLNETKTIFDEISDSFPYLKNTEIRNTLAAFVFTGDDVFKTISTLSGGEKGRVALAKLMLSNANLLLLDEPTNHLDMFSREVLEEAIRGYTGTILYVSHDRYFINNTASKILDMDKGGIVQYLGNYDYYIEKKALLVSENHSNAKTETPEETFKESWLQRKENTANDRKRLAKLTKLEREIALKEEKIKELDLMLLKEHIYTDAEKANLVFLEKTNLEEELYNLYEQWEQINE